MNKYNLDVSTWIKKDGRRKEAWAKKYISSSTKLLHLYKEGAGISPYEPGAMPTNITTDHLIGIVSTVYEHGLEGYKEFSKMKSAWSQYNYRRSLKDKKKQTFNFVLSKDVKPALKMLSEARGLPINQIVEQAIMDLLEPAPKEIAPPTKAQHPEFATSTSAAEVRSAPATLEEQLERLLEEKEQLAASRNTNLNTGGASQRANRSGWLGAKSQRDIKNINAQIDEIQRTIKRAKQEARTGMLKRGNNRLSPLRQNKQKNKGSEITQGLKP